MPTDDVIDLCTTIPLWVVVAVRAYHWPRTPGKRAILGTFTALAIGATLRLSYLEDALVHLTGLKDAAVLPKHLAVIVACHVLVGWLDAVVPRREQDRVWRRWLAIKPRRIVLAAALLTASAAFPFAEPSVIASDGSRDFATAQYGDVAGTAHLAVYLMSMGAALAPSALLCLAVARRTDDRLLRLCMRLMAAGTAAGAFYPVYRLTFLLCGFTGWTYPLDADAFHRGGSLIQAATLLPILAGSSVRAAELMLRAVRLRRGLILLRPLWEELVSVLPPDTVRSRLQTTPSAREEHRRLRDLYGRLDERVVDISDAVLELRDWVSADLHREALTAARTAGLHGANARAAREALCLRVARMKAIDGEPYPARPAETVLSLRDDLQANAGWLALVAHHYTSPRLTHAATQLAGQTTPQEVTA
ncbi:DUF6545 domain-containing protein [Streptomyces hirsutus]|uniref:DUF6545 domain-containing protein n=1 Tax=Streptomyces hirsutus TaxID=35620 RepID=UPI00332FE70E